MLHDSVHLCACQYLLYVVTMCHFLPLWHDTHTLGPPDCYCYLLCLFLTHLLTWKGLLSWYNSSAHQTCVLYVVYLSSFLWGTVDFKSSSHDNELMAACERPSQIAVAVGANQALNDTRSKIILLSCKECSQQLWHLIHSWYDQEINWRTHILMSSGQYLSI